MMKKNYGFTLIELMIVLVMMAILLAIAIPSYQQYMRKQDLAIAKQEALRIASELERFKSKNFSYKGFDASYIYSSYNNSTGTLYLPVGSAAADGKYVLTLVDADLSTPTSDTKKPLTVVKSGGVETADSQSVKGLNWAIKVERFKVGGCAATSGFPKDPQNYDLLLRGNGLRCMTKNTITNYGDCGTSGVETW